MKFKIKKDIDIERLESYKHQQGMKNSSKRAFVVSHFLSRDRHYSVEELYREIQSIKPGIGYSTIYRTLKVLAQCGIASKCIFADGLQRFEPYHSAKHHDHLICTKCGRIIEFKNDGIEELQRRVARSHNFRVKNHELKLYGVCSVCMKKSEKKIIRRSSI